MNKHVRKIIRVGNTSHAVIIPKGWLRYYGLKESDPVEVITSNKITIKPLKEEGDG